MIIRLCFPSFQTSFIFVIKMSIPKFRACPLCNKSCFIVNKEGNPEECPICPGTSSKLGQAGWATKEEINDYFHRIAVENASQRTAKQIEIFKNSNPDISKNKIKARVRVLMNLFLEQELFKLKDKMIQDDSR